MGKDVGETVTVTAKDIINGLWDMANTSPSKTRGKIGSQKSALRGLLSMKVGLDFIVRRPAAELDELGRREVCSPNLNAILRELAGVELLRRKTLRARA